MSAEAAFQAYRERSFFGSLNGIRALCVLMVMWHHSPAFFMLDTDIMLLKRGFTGVDFFFVLSGYLITTLLIREEARDGWFSLKGFYQRRILRIVPVYFLVVSAMGLYYVVIKGEVDYAPLLPYYYLFLGNILNTDIPNLAPTWSLSVEEQFYIVWPLLLLLLPARAVVRIWVLILLITICFLGSEGLLSWTGIRPIETEHATWTLPLPSFGAILLGALLAVLLQTRKGFSMLWRVLQGRGVALVLFAVLLVLWQLLPGALAGWPNLLMHGTMTLILAAVVVHEDHWARPVLAWRPLARMGEISYGIYLYHLIGLQIARELLASFGLRFETDPWTVTLVFMVLSVLIAEISFRTYERYFLSLKTRLARKDPGQLPSRAR